MRYLLLLIFVAIALFDTAQAIDNPQSSSLSEKNNLLGLPSVPIPADNPQTPAKIELGDKLFHDKRFSVDGTVSCANCHDENKAFTDNLPVSVGHNGLTGTRNAPTVLNAAYNHSQFWDGREPDLEGQAKQPLINPVEHGLPSYEPLLEITRTDPYYQTAFQAIFGVNGKHITIDHVAKAIASFERTVIWGGQGHEGISLHSFLRSFLSLTAPLSPQKNSNRDPGSRFGAFTLSYRLPMARNWLKVTNPKVFGWL